MPKVLNRLRTAAEGPNGAGLQEVPSALYVQSRGMNLVTNGTGMLRNAYGWPAGFDFYPQDTFTGPGSFRSTVTPHTAVLTEFLPVDPSRFYQLSAWIKAIPDLGQRFYFGLEEFDVDGLGIRPGHTMRQPGTDTVLAAPLTPGDTTIQVASAANWNNAAGAQPHLRTVIIWGYKNSLGYYYPVHTYSRVALSNAYADGGINFGTGVITLNAPWPSSLGNPDHAQGTWPAGTPLSNGSSGGTYKYVAAANPPTPADWTYFGGRIGGRDLTGTNRPRAFSPATAQVKVIFLLNRTTAGAAVPGAGTAVSGLWFSEVDPEQVKVSQQLYDDAGPAHVFRNPAGGGTVQELARYENATGTVVYGSVTGTGKRIFNAGVQIPPGAGAGKVLTSDAQGNATWQDPPAGGATPMLDKRYDWTTFTPTGSTVPKTVPLYIGEAPKDTATSAAGWTIKRYTYTTGPQNDAVVALVETETGSWDNRASLFGP